MEWFRDGLSGWPGEIFKNKVFTEACLAAASVRGERERQPQND